MQIIPLSMTNQYNTNNSNLIKNKKNLNFRAVEKVVTEDLLKKGNKIIESININGSNLTEETAKTILTAFEGILVVLGLNKITKEKDIENEKKQIDIEKEKILEKIIPIIARTTDASEEEITPEKEFVIDFGCDSIDNVVIILATEEEFGIKTKDEDTEKMKTVKDFIDIIYSEIAKKK